MGDVRILTVRQPWAELIMSGQKPVENRTRRFPSTVGGWMCCPYHPDVRWRVGTPPPDGCHRDATGASTHRLGQWDGQYPVRIGIHAAARSDRAAIDRLSDTIQSDSYMLGAVLGSVEVTGCHHADECHETHSELLERPAWCSRWAEPGGVYHWTLANPRPLATPVPAKGRLGLWRPDADLATQLEQAVPA